MLDQRGVWALVLGVGAVVFGAIALLRAAFTFRRVRKINWVQVEGRVQQAKTRIDPEGVMCAIMSYEYEVDGQTYKSNTISVDGVDGLHYPADLKLVDRYNPGDSLDVFFNRVEPSEACLRPGRYGEVPVLVVVGTVIAVAGVLILWQAS